MQLINYGIDSRDPFIKKLKGLKEEKHGRKERDKVLGAFIASLTAEEMWTCHWDPKLWVALLDYAKVYADHIDFVFLDGKTIPVEV